MMRLIGAPSRWLSTGGRRVVKFRLLDAEGLPRTPLGRLVDSDDESQEQATWRLLKTAMDEQQEVYARVIKKTRQGVLLDVLGRIAFMPYNLAADAAPPRTPASASTLKLASMAASATAASASSMTATASQPPVSGEAADAAPAEAGGSVTPTPPSA